MAIDDYPADLVAAQHELTQVRTDLHALYTKLPWSVEPLPAFSDQEIWRPRTRPESPGWPDADQAEVARLRGRELELATTIMTHPHWATVDPSARHAARMALKHV